MNYGLLISLLFIPVITTSPAVLPQNPPLNKQNQPTLNERRENVQMLVNKYARQYGVNSQEMMAVIACESGYNELALGDGNNSRGLVQIHKPSHPTVTDEQAFDPDFSVRFMAEQFSKGNQWMWSCYKKQAG